MLSRNTVSTSILGCGIKKNLRDGFPLDVYIFLVERVAGMLNLEPFVFQLLICSTLALLTLVFFIIKMKSQQKRTGFSERRFGNYIGQTGEIVTPMQVISFQARLTRRRLPSRPSVHL